MVLCLGRMDGWMDVKVPGVRTSIVLTYLHTYLPTSYLPMYIHLHTIRPQHGTQPASAAGFCDQTAAAHLRKWIG